MGGAVSVVLGEWERPVGGRPPVPSPESRAGEGFWGAQDSVPSGGRSAVTERAPGALPDLDSDAKAPHAQASPRGTPALTKETNHVAVWEACLPVNE